MPNAQLKLDRREFSRFSVDDGAYVLVKPSNIGVGRLVNIGMSGLSFDYVTDKAPSLEVFEVEVFLTDSSFRLIDIPCQCIWDLAIYEIPTTYLHKRRCGVQFGRLTSAQLSQLEHFIQNHTNGRV